MRAERTRRALPWVGAAVALVVAVVVAGPEPEADDRYLDPASTGPSGARALVLLVDRFGADVDEAPEPAPDADVALLLEDRLDEAAAEGVARWVDAGGTLVVADPASGFAPEVVDGEPAAPFGAGATLTRRCELAALRDARRLRVGAAPAYEAPLGAVACFPSGDGAFLAAEARGDGTVVALASPGVWVNAAIDEEDHGALAVGLLAPRPGSRVTLLRPREATTEPQGLADLVPGPVKAVLVQLAVAFGLFALWRARRLGRPVAEAQPVAVPGSELVGAVGNLFAQARRRDRAAFLLRDDLRRNLADRLGLPPDAAPDVVAAVAATRSGVAPERVARVLDDRPPGDDAELVALAQSVEALRQEVAGAR